jgi:phosphoribosylaminoimidazolecarboxamide formyltransferase/IMP cyclohydrolase
MKEPDREIYLKVSGLSLSNSISLSSDAFMPFRDNVDNAVKFNIKNIIQPGGSMMDYSVIEACNQYDILMVFSGKRLFLH